LDVRNKSGFIIKKLKTVRYTSKKED
jgi:hypothetical protein